MLLTYPHELLKNPVEKFDFEKHNAIIIAHNLAEAMLAYDGVGLAANQIGMNHNALAVRAEQIIVMFNPLVVDSSDDTSYIVEGCLSSPGLFINIKRPNTIRVRYSEPNGNIVTKQFSGLTSRIIQHEIDHLNGVDFSQRATRYHLEQARKKQKKLNLTPHEMLQRFAR